MSWADELEPAAFYGSDAAFPARWRDGDWTTRSVLAAGSPPADCAGGKLGWPPWGAPVGGAGAASLSGTTTPSSLSNPGGGRSHQGLDTT